MTVLSRALIHRMIIQEMRLSAPSRTKLTNGLSFDNDKTLDIDSDTEIDDIPSFVSSFEDTEFDDDELDIDLEDDFGIVLDDDDSQFEFESETEEDSESETEYNPGRGVTDMSRDELRKHVMSVADRLSPDMSKRKNKTRAEIRYDDLVKQGREAEMSDPEFMNTKDLEGTLELPVDRMRKKINESIRAAIRRSINL